MWNDDDIDLLEAFVEGRLPAEAKASMEQRLAIEPGMADKLARYRATRRAIVDQHEDARVRALLRTAGQQAQHRRNGWWRWAAAAAAIGGGVMLWVATSREPSPQTLSERYSVQEPPLPVLMSAEHDRAMDRVMQLYANGALQQALGELAALPANDTVMFYRAVIMDRIGRDARPEFRALAEKGPGPYQAKALYHLLLADLQRGELVRAAAVLEEQVKIQDHPYKAQLEAIKRSGVLPR